jgi:putative transposase
MKSRVVLSKREQSFLKDYVSKGVHPARCIRRARALLLLHEGLPQVRVAGQVGCCLASVTNLLTRYPPGAGEGGRSHPGAPPPRPAPAHNPGEVEAGITTLACSKTPDGRSEWTLRLIAGKVVELGLAPHLSHEAVRGC